MEEDSKKKPGQSLPSCWDVRRNIVEAQGWDAALKYDAYLKEHRLKLSSLERIARGDVAPSDEWYARMGKK